MGFAACVAGCKIVSVILNINYLKPIPLGANIQVHGIIVSKEGKKIYTEREILLEYNEVLVKGSAILIEPNGFSNEEVTEFYNSAANKHNLEN